MVALAAFTALVWLASPVASLAQEADPASAVSPAPQEDEAPIAETVEDQSEATAETEPATPPEPDISIAALSTRNFLSSASISPDGKLLGHFIQRDDQTMLAIVDSGSHETVRLFAPSLGDFKDWFWAGPRRVVVTSTQFSIFSMLFYGIPVTVTQVFDLDSGESHLVGFSDQDMEGDDILHIDPYGRFLILSVGRGRLADPDVWRFPLDGSGPEAAVMVQQARKGIDEWFADETGAVRLGMRYRGRKKASFYYRSAPGEELEEIARIRLDEESEVADWNVLSMRAGSDLGYALAENAQGRVVVREFNYRLGQMGQVVYENPDWDVTGVTFNRDGSLESARYTDDVPRRHWFDPAVSAIRSQLNAVLGPGETSIVSKSDTGRMLVLHRSASDPGVLYSFRPALGELAIYSEIRPQVDESRTVMPQAVTYRARDGVPIRAYLALPPGGDGPHPLIVMPHGGPYGVRDTLEYDDQVQLLATRGYAVLQPNFRGSDGYGRAFAELGDGQIGRAMQDDLDDAMDWAVAQGHADAGRVCIVGGSYGGYAALWGVIRNPERYRCAASWAGVTELDKQIKASRGAFISRKAGRRWRNRLEGEEAGERFDLDAVSPARNAERLTRPVLLAHGTADRVVPYEQYELMVKAAQKADKTLETLTIKGAGHGFAKAAQEAEWYEALITFLQKHNPPDPPAAGEPAPAVEK